MRINIYHNSSCGKSRLALKKLQDLNLDFEVILYKQQYFDSKYWLKLMMKSSLSPISFLRSKEELYKINILNHPNTFNQVASILEQYPELLERPVLESPTFSIIARDETSIETFINHINSTK